MGNVQKSFNTMGLGVILTNVTAAVIEAEKKARSSREIQTLDVLRPGLRQDIYIGKIMVIPPSVMDDPEKVPLPLFKGAILNLFDSETAAAYDSHRLAESEFDELKNSDFAQFKDRVFKEGNEKFACVIMFLPAWSSPRDYVGFRFDKDAVKLEQLIRHLVFSAYFNPSLSSLFETLEENQLHLDVKNLQHDHFGPVFDLMSAENTYPILEKKGGLRSTRKPLLRFAAHELDAIKEELISPEEKAVLDELSDEIVAKIASVDAPEQKIVTSDQQCKGCGGVATNSNLLCDACQSKQKFSLEDEEDTLVERFAVEVAADAENMAADTYLNSSEDSMGLIEDVNDETYDESIDEAIYEVMALKGVPYGLAERVAERAREIMAEGSGSPMHDDEGEDIDIDSLMDDSLPPELQAELDAIDEKSGWEKPVTSSKEKRSFIDFFAKCSGCGAITPGHPGATDDDLIFCPGCDQISKEQDNCPECVVTETQVDKKIGSVAEVPKTDYPDPARKGTAQSITPEQKIKSEKYNEPTRKTEMPKKIAVSSSSVPDAQDEKKEDYFEIERKDEPDEAHQLTSRPDYASPASLEKKQGGLKSFRRSLRPSQVKQSSDKSDDLARHIYWKCFEKRDSATMATIKDCVGDYSFSELQDALMYMWKRNLVIPSEKFNSWKKVGPETEKNTFTGKWPWNVHQAGRELKVMDREGPYVIMSLKNDYLAMVDGEAEWTRELQYATRFHDSEEADDAAFNYGGEVYPDPGISEAEDKAWLSGIGIQGSKESDCSACHGTGVNKRQDDCSICGGSGKSVMKRPSANDYSFSERDKEVMAKKAITYMHPGDSLHQLDEDQEDVLLRPDFVQAPDIKLSRKKSHYRKMAFDWTAPGQVLQEFYPEVKVQLQDQQQDKDDYHPVKPDEQERESRSNEDLRLNDYEAEEKHSLTSPGLVSTESGGGAPLRSRERNIRGPFFMDQFYKIHADIPAAQLTVKSSLNKTAAEFNKVELVESYLANLSAEIASSLLAAFIISPKLSFIGQPTEGTIDLKATPVAFMNPMLSKDVQNPIVNQLAVLFESLADNELTEAINNAWSQSAVWKEDGKAGFLYEIFVRIEAVDIDNMVITYRFVANKKEK